MLDKRKGTAYVIITYFQIETFVKTGVRIIYIFGTCICYMYMLHVYVTCICYRFDLS